MQDIKHDTDATFGDMKAGIAKAYCGDPIATLKTAAWRPGDKVTCVECKEVSKAERITWEWDHSIDPFSKDNHWATIQGGDGYHIRQDQTDGLFYASRRCERIGWGYLTLIAAQHCCASGQAQIDHVYKGRQEEVSK